MAEIRGCASSRNFMSLQPESKCFFLTLYLQTPCPALSPTKDSLTCQYISIEGSDVSDLNHPRVGNFINLRKVEAFDRATVSSTPAGAALDQPIEGDPFPTQNYIDGD
jgi:hypothetical protein